MLSKIGKPKTPPRNPSLGSIESSPTSSLSFHQQQQQQSGRHPNQLRSLSFPHSSYSNSAYSDPPIKKEPSYGYGDSPQSRPVSPGLNSSITNPNSFTDWRSPPSSAHESDQHAYYPQRFPSSTNVQRQQKSRRSTSGSLLSSYDESAANSLSLNNTASTISERPSRLKRESYDPTKNWEADSADSTFPMEDSVSKLRLEDRPPPNSKLESLPYYYKRSNPSLHTSRSRPGMKRKPSQSPPPDPAHEANSSLAPVGGNNTDLYQRNVSTPQHPSHRLSPVGRQFAQNQGSFSSQSSAGPRNNSYASSAGLSVASSITTLDQHSPGISPSSEQQQQLLYQQHNGQDSPYVTSLPINQGPRNNRSQQQYPQAPLENHPTPPLDQKAQNLQNQRKNNAPPNMQQPSFICVCCPKKPKKFETLEELR